MSDQSLGKYNKKPMMRVQKAEVSHGLISIVMYSQVDVQNAAKALQFIRDSGVKLTNIGKQLPKKIPILLRKAKNCRP